jgi:pantoate--beta-alanine ligase
MIVIESVAVMQAQSRAWQADGDRVALVPTMGALHEGHMALVAAARAAAGRVVVSIFVNPLQFGPGEDFTRYPRNLARDLALCETAGADAVFCPPVAVMYAGDRSVHIDEVALSQGLCGASRPGHFRGVLTVVAKLFNSARPDVAVFGQKDAQQVAVIRRLVRDLDYPIELVVVPTLREPDGLALSSRNAYLCPGERQAALSLNRALRAAEGLVGQGVKDCASLVRAMREILLAAPGVAPEYVTAVDAMTLQPVERVDAPVLLALAARVGATRLIDNTVVGLPSP